MVRMLYRSAIVHPIWSRPLRCYALPILRAVSQRGPERIVQLGVIHHDQDVLGNGDRVWKLALKCLQVDIQRPERFGVSRAHDRHVRRQFADDALVVFDVREQQVDGSSEPDLRTGVEECSELREHFLRKESKGWMLYAV